MTLVSGLRARAQVGLRSKGCRLHSKRVSQGHPVDSAERLTVAPLDGLKPGSWSRPILEAAGGPRVAVPRQEGAGAGGLVDVQ